MKKKTKSKVILTNKTKNETNHLFSNNWPAHKIQIQKLFEDELKSIYWTEKALLKVIPKMLENATSEDLISELEGHLNETDEQIKRIGNIFTNIGKEAQVKKHEAMEGLIKDSERIMNEYKKGIMCDLGIISEVQKIKHYEIAAYSTLHALAKKLGFNEADALLEETLYEEKIADKKLTEVVDYCLNEEPVELEEEA